MSRSVAVAFCTEWSDSSTWLWKSPVLSTHCTEWSDSSTWLWKSAVLSTHCTEWSDSSTWLWKSPVLSTHWRKDGQHLYMLFVDNGDSASAGNEGTCIDNWETFTIWHLNQLPTKFIKSGLSPLKRSGNLQKMCASQKLIFLYVPHPHPISLLLDWLTKRIPQFRCSYGGIEFTVYV